METVRQDLHNAITTAMELLATITEESSETRPTPEGWTPKEVLGHLIDSATQNHHRFVELFGQENLEFPPYDQEHWVGTQQYQARPWQELVIFWHAYNLHLAHLIELFPTSEFDRPRHPHNLDRFTTPIAPAEASVTLKDLVRHYLDHMQIHLNQIRQASKF